MRKRTIKYLCDNIFWYTIYLLPVIFALIYWFKTGSSNLSTIMSTGGFSILSTNVIYTSLSSLFGVDGIFPLFQSPDILMFLTYFVSVMIIHLAVDVLLFIVRLAHDWLDGVFGGKNE